MVEQRQSIEIKGAKENNLKNIDLEIPRGKLNVVTGLSGSGKSTLAFDTVFAEGQRRYMESLSSYARNFLDQMDKPEVESIEGLSPAISIEQNTSGTTPRSTVGTVTEIHDYLRLLYARIGTQYSPETGKIVEEKSAEQIADEILELPEDTKIKVLAPVETEEFAEKVEKLKERGFTRIITDQEYDLDLEEPESAGSFEIVVDRIKASGDSRSRLVEALENGLDETDGKVWIEVSDEVDDERIKETNGRKLLKFTEGFSEPGNSRDFSELEQRSFSFNSPLGACDECDGLGKSEVADEDLVVPDSSVAMKNALAPWNYSKDYYRRGINAFADHFNVDVNTPFEELDRQIQEKMLHGTREPIYYTVEKMRGNGLREKRFEGVMEYINRRFQETSSDNVRSRLRDYMREDTCPVCDGTRLSEQSRHVEVAGLTLPEINRMNIESAYETFQGLEDQLEGRDREIGEEIVKEVRQRLGFLDQVGLSYLTLDREAATLSGGETQRIRLATQIGSGLTGVLYVLDEPSIGLHRHDNEKLIDTLENLRDLGNTLLVVEHDESTVKRADNIIDIGPGPGKKGGEIVGHGKQQDIESVENSVTGKYLSGEKKIPVPDERRSPEDSITVKGAKEHNLDDVDVEIPLGVITAITGMSGSGKSTLMHDILYNQLTKQLNDNKSVIVGEHEKVEGAENIESVRMIDQSPIGRTPRSNPATYTGVFDYIRELFAETKLSKRRGYDKGRFSFNVKGGRCEECKGQGTVQIEMNFLSDVYVECERCGGKRYNDETLQVKYRGKSIAEILGMEIEEAYEFFEHDRRIKRRLKLLKDVGLGYMELGQPSTTLSGGEAQRIKLAEELGKVRNEDVLYMLDEPTTGLHWEDERKLIKVLHRLVEKGNSVLVIEHELELVKCADCIIDLGPKGGENGGQIVAQGTPEQVAENPDSFTGQYLEELLD
ncbi:excinuclease ABC subunit UvrA [Candidatus Nanohalococcus occultus]|uniref:Excinuclease ABC subunit A, ATPase n=1 Tax=Candidatus Nanohalococcus occultus TaxID=2978047 RepID=A0ABY8CF19_9ARCH|nr:Excinuclease ABC subunit A, ATPase [Candidatus Nanohaloarchaeota archaeon SVXNc]